ncbi:hypothetical protein RFI_24554 [Reticulomyxa filosa]|uniref:Uncharacterized protein n=1 Tax=Reticulomyxa filosa TaxID=46433 RepID=X6MFN1_RETFI|nr:hypothetical protein RFI_24554 [Reticulomyxa filosa]|eukprot:ETO12818.1 hypothetical protein RFI_24554 [Reticulomyxa filosa]
MQEEIMEDVGLGIRASYATLSILQIIHIKPNISYLIYAKVEEEKEQQNKVKSDSQILTELIVRLKKKPEDYHVTKGELGEGSDFVSKVYWGDSSKPLCVEKGKSKKLAVGNACSRALQILRGQPYNLTTDINGCKQGIPLSKLKFDGQMMSDFVECHFQHYYKYAKTSKEDEVPLLKPSNPHSEPSITDIIKITSNSFGDMNSQKKKLPLPCHELLDENFNIIAEYFSRGLFIVAIFIFCFSLLFSFLPCHYVRTSNYLFACLFIIEDVQFWHKAKEVYTKEERNKRERKKFEKYSKDKKT